jgi:hypothetical protein
VTKIFDVEHENGFLKKQKKVLLNLPPQTLMLRNGSAPRLQCWVCHEAGGLAWHHTQHNGQGI